mmetsp:Transcript_55270/g.179543  ORF Transcript_55270/g.179543 Transcript_55270/m.179543 type:complete len:206 (-) Transcript_55270:843-1460(-)
MGVRSCVVCRRASSSVAIIGSGHKHSTAFAHFQTTGDVKYSVVYRCDQVSRCTSACCSRVSSYQQWGGLCTGPGQHRLVLCHHAFDGRSASVVDFCRCPPTSVEIPLCISSSGPCQHVVGVRDSHDSGLAADDCYIGSCSSEFDTCARVLQCTGPCKYCLVFSCLGFSRLSTSACYICCVSSEHSRLLASESWKHRVGIRAAAFA